MLKAVQRRLLIVGCCWGARKCGQSGVSRDKCHWGRNETRNREQPVRIPTIDTAQVRRDLSSWAGCIAGALTDAEYCAGLEAAGFTAIDLEITRRYTVTDIPASATGWAAGLAEATRAELVGRFANTFVRATKPASGS